MKPTDIFWSDWKNRQPDEKRGLERADALIHELGLDTGLPPLLTIVGSKGKGTAAAYASACLAAAGLTVVTVTSPALRNVRDRIRCDGHAISYDELDELARELSEAHRRLPRYQPGHGYLSPSGLFIIAGALYARREHADLAVLEAGMGGASDEVSLFSPTVVGITRIFGEHIGVLGDTPADIARDKAAVTTSATKAVISLPQDAMVTDAIEETVRSRSSGRVAPEFPAPGSSGVPIRSLPPAFGRANAELGCLAAFRTIHILDHQEPPTAELLKVLSSVTLPGRCSFHPVPGTSAEIFADAAISRTGLAAALTQATLHWDTINRVLVCLPDHKDVAGAIAELADLPVTAVRLTDKPRLKFTHQVPATWEVADMDKVDREFLVAHGPRIAALGTGYFIARMLELVDANTETLFSVT